MKLRRFKHRSKRELKPQSVFSFIIPASETLYTLEQMRLAIADMIVPAELINGEVGKVYGINIKTQ